jgi:hypothetical protein
VEKPVRCCLRPLCLLIVLATGCSVAPVAKTSNNGSGPPTPTPGTAPVRGLVYGGQQPIVGAQVYLLAVSTTGAGQQSTSLLTNVPGDTSNSGSVNGWYYVNTVAGGSFAIQAADYSCTTGQQVYLYSVGGNPQVAGTNNAAGLMALLGNCTAPGTFSGVPATVQMNEVTTVAAAYALAGFAKDATDISGAATATTAIANAAASAANLASLSTGIPATATAGNNGTVPQAEILTLANILGACINSQNPVNSGPPPSGSACDTLFKNATTNGKSDGPQPTDTASAAINIAHNPSANISALFGMVTAFGSAAFTGGLQSAPNDFTVAVTYTGAGLNQPQSIAIDGNGDVWTANGGISISKLSPLGAPISGAGGFTGGGPAGAVGVAIDQQGDAWGVINTSPGALSEINSSGTAISPSGGYTGGGLIFPQNAAIDASGNAWVTNPGANAVSEFTASGAPLSPTGGYTGGGLSNPLGIVVDAYGNIWTANSNNNSLTELSSSGAAISPAGGYTGGGLNFPFGIAITSAGYLWVTNEGGSSLSEFNPSGTAISGSGGFTGGGLSNPRGIAIDGAGNIWAGNQTNTVSEFSPSGLPISGSGGYASSGLNSPWSIAIDASGNLWAANYGTNANSVTEFIGVATPVAETPLAEQPFLLTIATTSLPGGTEGTPYSATLSAAGGTKPYTWVQSGGTSLSTWGLTLDGPSGSIYGTPTATASNAQLTFTVKDSSNPQQQQVVTLGLTIGANMSVTLTSITPRNSAITTHQAPGGLSLSATTSDGSGVLWSASAGSFSSETSASGASVTYTPPVAAGAYVVTATAASNTSSTLTASVGVTDLGGVYTWHNDPARTGANTHEYALTTASVKAGTFGKLFSCTVDSPIYTQPLWVPNVTIGSGPYAGTTHNVVFVATTNDSLFAFDADGPGCIPLWQTESGALNYVSLLDSDHGGTAGEVPVPSGPPQCTSTTFPSYCVGRGSGDIQPLTGVIGTPVIDPSTNTLYVVSKSVIESGNSTFYQRLHAIDITTGAEKFSGPGNITGAITSSCAKSGCTQPAFSPQYENQRCGLALGNDGTNNVVYVSWAGHEDGTPYYGWIVGFNATTLAPEYVYNADPDSNPATPNGGGIWMSGAAPAMDSSGNIYVTTGNGLFDANKTTTPHDDYGDSMVKLTPALAVNDYFTPSNQSGDAGANDLDFGSGGVLVLPDLAANGTNPTHLVIAGGKNASGGGNFFMLNRDNLGKFDTGPSNTNGSWQRLSQSDSIFATGAFWNSTYYVGENSQSLLAWTLSPSTAKMTLVGAGKGVTPNSFNFPGPTPSVTSTPSNTNGILWAVDESNYCTNSSNACGPAVLYAYDATNLSTQLWSSGTTGPNVAGNAMKFVVPTVANGRVYLSTRGNNTGDLPATTTVPGELDVYGLLP